jgi:hypothetical protein
MLLFIALATLQSGRLHTAEFVGLLLRRVELADLL